MKALEWLSTVSLAQNAAGTYNEQPERVKVRKWPDYMILFDR